MAISAIPACEPTQSMEELQASAIVQRLAGLEGRRLAALAAFGPVPTVAQVRSVPETAIIAAFVGQIVAWAETSGWLYDYHECQRSSGEPDCEGREDC